MDVLFCDKPFSAPKGRREDSGKTAGAQQRIRNPHCFLPDFAQRTWTTVGGQTCRSAGQETGSQSPSIDTPTACPPPPPDPSPASDVVTGHTHTQDMYHPLAATSAGFTAGLTQQTSVIVAGQKPWTTIKNNSANATCKVVSAVPTNKQSSADVTGQTASVVTTRIKTSAAVTGLTVSAITTKRFSAVTTHPTDPAVAMDQSASTVTADSKTSAGVASGGGDTDLSDTTNMAAAVDTTGTNMPPGVFRASRVRGQCTLKSVTTPLPAVVSGLVPAYPALSPAVVPVGGSKLLRGQNIGIDAGSNPPLKCGTTTLPGHVSPDVVSTDSPLSHPVVPADGCHSITVPPSSQTVSERISRASLAPVSHMTLDSCELCPTGTAKDLLPSSPTGGCVSGENGADGGVGGHCGDVLHSGIAAALQDKLRQTGTHLRRYRNKTMQVRHQTENKYKMLGALRVRRSLLTSEVVTMIQLIQTSRLRLDEQRVANKELMKYIDHILGVETGNTGTRSSWGADQAKPDVDVVVVKAIVSSDRSSADCDSAAEAPAAASAGGCSGGVDVDVGVSCSQD